MEYYWVFDLDGCLVDTKEAVRQAYLLAGVTMPADAWGRPVGDWCTPEQHRQKNTYYSVCLKGYSRPGPAYPVWQAMRGNKVILTGASKEAWRLVSIAYPSLLDAQIVKCGLTWQEKARELRNLKTGVYFDDDARAGENIVEGTGFEFIHSEIFRCAH